MIGLIPGPDATFKKGQRVRYCGTGNQVPRGDYGSVMTVYLGEKYEVYFDDTQVTLVTDVTSLEAAPKYVRTFNGFY